ncbi:MAG: hypothetical protein EHM24_17760 [Acidobacteria bacterium]|nr:MAG: hypothetical protein EHM24_17760 [Acidobacteriota bacterium]
MRVEHGEAAGAARRDRGRPRPRGGVVGRRGGKRGTTVNGQANDTAPARNLGVILDIDLPVVVRFAQANLTLQALARMGPGSVVRLERAPDDPVEVLVNGRVIARGQVVVVGGNYGVRITEVRTADERIQSMAS